MNKRTGYIIGAVIVVLAISLIMSFNSLVQKQELVKLQWSEVQNAYQRRIDLIPNLVNAVKGQANFEQTTLLQVTAARAKAASINISTNAVNANQYQQQVAVQDQLAAATNRLLVTVEKYPALQGTEAFRGLQSQLEGSERRIKFARKDFNTAIEAYNSYVRSFPTKLAAGLFGFQSQEGFQSIAGADKSVEIKF